MVERPAVDDSIAANPTATHSPVAVFVDVQNIYYTTKQAYGRPFNYRQFWQHLTSKHTVTAATAYATQRTDANGQRDHQQIKFQDALRHIGFDVKLTPYLQRADGSAKGDWDVGITVDIMEAAMAAATQSINNLKVVLLSGDGDFATLLEHLRIHYNITSDVYGVPDLTARSLQQAAEHFHPIHTENLM